MRVLSSQTLAFPDLQPVLIVMVIQNETIHPIWASSGTTAKSHGLVV